MEQGERPWSLQVAEGILLHGQMSCKLPTPGDQARTAVVILHPMAALGGSMHDPVTSILYRHLSRLPQVGISLRYNRRGVGQSTGRVALWADSDCQDLKAVCAHVAAMQSSSLQGSASSADMRLWVIGYSWGAILAAHTSCFHEVHGVICVSPPAGFLANHVLHSHKHLMTLGQTEGAHKPKLVLTGTADGIASVKSVRWIVGAVNTLLQKIEDGKRQDDFSSTGDYRQDQYVESSRQPGSNCVRRLRMEECAGATHFWTEREHIIRMLEHVQQIL